MEKLLYIKIKKRKKTGTQRDSQTNGQSREAIKIKINKSGTQTDRPTNGQTGGATIKIHRQTDKRTDGRSDSKDQTDGRRDGLVSKEREKETERLVELPSRL